MVPNLQDLGIDRLSVEDRIALAQAIWDSIDPDAASVLSDAQRAELERRLADHEQHPERAVPWEVVKANVLANLGQ
ncbi:MAG TPA: addiction module protein [Pirellulales bacterium]|jgi:putative addiction module component (TIGR02574 family)|nr:addiction module protein [Pirellulales bacterium]